MEYPPRIHHIGALHQSPRVTVKIERNTRKNHWTDYLHVDVQRHLMGAKRFGARQWSFFGIGSEKNWYSVSEDNTQGEWDKMAEQMMFTFAESKHTIFRSTTPLSRGVLKSKGGEKLSIHHFVDPGTI